MVQYADPPLREGEPRHRPRQVLPVTKCRWDSAVHQDGFGASSSHAASDAFDVTSHELAP